MSLIRDLQEAAKTIKKIIETTKEIRHLREQNEILDQELLQQQDARQLVDLEKEGNVWVRKESSPPRTTKS